MTVEASKTAWLVGRLVAAMDGSIDIESNAGKRTTFVVRLPPSNEKTTHEQ